jgi:hypothetical protein
MLGRSTCPSGVDIPEGRVPRDIWSSVWRVPGQGRSAFSTWAPSSRGPLELLLFKILPCLPWPGQTNSWSTVSSTGAGTGNMHLLMDCCREGKGKARPVILLPFYLPPWSCHLSLAPGWTASLRISVYLHTFHA